MDGWKIHFKMKIGKRCSTLTLGQTHFDDFTVRLMSIQWLNVCTWVWLVVYAMWMTSDPWTFVSWDGLQQVLCVVLDKWNGKYMLQQFCFNYQNLISLGYTLYFHFQGLTFTFVMWFGNFETNSNIHKRYLKKAPPAKKKKQESITPNIFSVLQRRFLRGQQCFRLNPVGIHLWCLWLCIMNYSLQNRQMRCSGL